MGSWEAVEEGYVADYKLYVFSDLSRTGVQSLMVFYTLPPYENYFKLHGHFSFYTTIPDSALVENT